MTDQNSGVSGTAFDERAYRDALGVFATGVAIVTTRCPTRGAIGVTINSLTSVSLRPPLVSWSLHERSSSRAVFDTATHFAIHILCVDQLAICRRFAQAAAHDRFEGLQVSPGLGGVPILDCYSALLECKLVHAFQGGDHIVYFGEVACFRQTDREALAFHRGSFGRFEPLSSRIA